MKILIVDDDHYSALVGFALRRRVTVVTPAILAATRCSWQSRRISRLRHQPAR
jgi:hypothetical protein